MTTTHARSEKGDTATAQAFATSWNNLPEGSVYTFSQFSDWLAPLTKSDIEGKRVLELGCGNASLMVHMATWRPALLDGVDLGDSVITGRSNMSGVTACPWHIYQDDLITFQPQEKYDVVYSVGVIHHLRHPHKGFEALVRATRSGGHFHGWVYGREGNGVVIYLVDPLRKVTSRLPWWFTKYAIATPLVVPFYLYAHVLSALSRRVSVANARYHALLNKLPLFQYSLWITKRPFSFFRHVAFDQLVTPQTSYISKKEIEGWLNAHPDVVPGSTYIIARNGNSWKFGGKKR